MKKILIEIILIATILILIILFSVGCNTSEKAKKQEVKNIILMIGNGKGLAKIQSGQLANTANLNLLRAQIHGFTSIPENNLVSQIIPCANDLAIGKKSKDKTLGLDSSGVAHPNIIELASLKGMSTGIIASGSVIKTIPASFIVHAIDKNQFESIAAEFLNSPVDLIIGEGLEYFERRTDSANLIQRFINKGYSVYHEVDKAVPSKKLLVLSNEKKITNIQIDTSNILLKSIELALESLPQNPKGFFLMIDGSQQNYKEDEEKKDEFLITKLIEFDKSIGIAFDFAEKNPGTLVIVTTDVEIDIFEKTSRNNTSLEMTEKNLANEKSKSMVNVYAYGILAKSFEGTYEKKEIFNKMVKLLNLISQ